jgi:ABC-type glycerol-3-phosphate transport system substrate-binding protein
MRCYKVIVEVNGNTIAVRWANTLASAEETLQQLVEAFEVEKSNVTIEADEIHTDTDKLLEFINSISKDADTDPYI